jgi:D-beta-D-heptose 7-phosphate kinase/D-beta-D-heptose 1-phosphate adenosyltransferase
MMLCVDGKEPVTLPAYRREVFDVSGAGDTVLAVLAAVIASGHDWIKAASLANLAASLVVARRGAAAATPGELLGAIAELSGQVAFQQNQALGQTA